MSQQEQIQLFESQQVRTIWDSEKEEWFFSIVDVCKILTNQPSYDLARNYWKVLKHRLIAEGFEPVTNCNQLKLVSPNDYKKRLTDVATSKELFRIIQSIPSKIAAQTRAQIEAQTGRCIISSEKASDYILPVETAESIPLKNNGNEE